MQARFAVLCVLAAGVAGCADPGPATAPEAVPAPVYSVDWSAHIVQGDTAEYLSHQHPTADVLWPYQKVGFDAEVPEGVTAIEVGLRWEGPGAFRIMLHSHNHAGGPSDYFMHVSAFDAQNPKCIRVPAEHVVPGMWEFMVRSDSEVVDVDYTLTVLTVGGALGPIDETHGHDRVEETSNLRDDTDVVQDACVLWQPGGHTH